MKINEIPHSFKLSRVSFLQWCVKEAAVAAVFMLSLTYSRSSDQEIAFFFCPLFVLQSCISNAISSGK